MNKFEAEKRLVQRIKRCYPLRIGSVGRFVPNSFSADTLSKELGSRTAISIKYHQTAFNFQISHKLCYVIF